MRIHSDVLTLEDLHAAARVSGVYIIREVYAEHGSQSRTRAFNVALSGTSPYRTQSGDRDHFAATWDEWGIFLAALFDVDPHAHTGKHGYGSADHFHWVTGDRFRTLTPAGQHKRHKWVGTGPSPHGGHAFRCECGAVTLYGTPEPASGVGAL